MQLWCRNSNSTTLMQLHTCSEHCDIQQPTTQSCRKLQKCSPGALVLAKSAATAALTSASMEWLKPRRRASSKPLNRKVVCRSPLGMLQEPHCQSGPGPAPSCSMSKVCQHVHYILLYDQGMHLRCGRQTVRTANQLYNAAAC